MAHKSALELVIASQIPVDPEGSQPRYFRSKKTIQTSSDLASFQNCVANQMEGKTFDDRAAVQDAFASAAGSC